jgi:hypothetical protein
MDSTDETLPPASPSPLADALGRIGWTPRRLVREINAWLTNHGQRHLRIDQTAAYPWINRGYLPRAPIPTVAAAVLSRELGEVVTVDQLWPGRSRATGAAFVAADSLDELATTDDAVQALLSLSHTTENDRRLITAAPGPVLHAAAVEGLRPTPHWNSPPSGRQRALAPQVDAIATHVASLRRLDDRDGGGALSLSYVTNELRAVLMLAESAGAGPRRQLLVIIADLAQLTGWMHFDAGMYGPAERYLLLSARVAQVLGDPGRAVNAVGMLSYAASSTGRRTEGLRIAEAAQRAMPPGDSLLEARLKGREASAAAVAGDLSRFRTASEHARTLLSERGFREAPSSAYLYYLTLDQISAEAGEGLVLLARRAGRDRHQLLDEAIAQLAPLEERGRADYPRSALLHSALLAEAYLRRGAAEQSVAVAVNALSLLSEVQSPRARQQLRALRSAYARRQRNRVVGEFLPEFDRALQV